MPDFEPSPLAEPERRAHDERRDCAAAGRRLPAIAAVVGAVSALAAWLLLHLMS